ncbi:MAG: AAA family ATPase [Tepidisphaerales bacterium]
MKPTRLVMSAFGPYAGTQKLDFRQLKDRQFFLIHGPTGAGKTTILDAMCYALFGDTSGERTGEQLRCQLADPGTPTCVEFDFTLGDKSYRVMRKPAQMRPGKRNRNELVQENGGATLYDRTGALTDDPEGAVIADRLDQVTAEVERLLGFRSAQFRQVILLPQGKFRELLLAKARDREEILRTLFKTDFYRLIELKLKEKAAALESSARTKRSARDALLQQAGVTVPEELSARRAEKRSGVEQLTSALTGLREQAAVARRRLDQAQADAARLEELAAAERALRGARQQEPERNSRKSRFDAGHRAAGLAADVRVLDGLGADLKRREMAAGTARLDINKAASANAAAEAALATRKAQEPRLELLKSELEQRRAKRDKVRQYGAKQSEFAELQKAAKKFQVLEDSARKTRDATERSLAGQREARDRVRDLAAKVEGRRLAAQQAAKRYTDRDALDHVRQELGVLRLRVEQASRRIDDLGQQTLEAKAALADIQRDWIEGQSAYLATQLHDGQPCPVCGSIDHPAPATSDRPLISKEQLDRAQGGVDHLRELEKSAHAELTRLTTESAAKSAAEESLLQALAEDAGQAVPALKSTAEMANREYTEAEKAQGQLAAQEKSVADLDLLLSKQRQAVEAAVAQCRVAGQAVAAMTATLAEMESGLPANLRTPEALDRAIRDSEIEIARIGREIRDAEAALSQAGQALAAATNALATADREVAACRAEYDAARRTFDEKRLGAGFASDDEYRAAILAETQMAAIAEWIATFDRTLAVASGRLQLAQSATAGIAPPDLAALAAATTAAASSVEANLAASTRLTVEIQAIDELIARLLELDALLADIERRYAIVGGVAEIAMGTGKNQARISFQRFVLSAFLDGVLLAATERLRIMSRNRYQLQRCRELEDRRLAGGLDIEVHDAWSGEARSVATLSGGESFLASLSLALGLADVVQTYSGGVRLETMFIDEGFGSLDTESLDLAIRAQMDLRKGGRLVGIISHVDELRELIDARLEVSAGDHGSRARFVVG